ncbi:MAG: hypothetical protein EOO25_19375 [Comamonadaceae bacterium]|nr:MAG: hypothetical protein EOO25_19375 [Comamonadaceae bacterium]
MSEWWTYGPSDFLMFSPEAYWRLVERYNAAWWPAQLVALASAGLVIALLRHKAGWAQRTVLLLLALAWAWTGWAFHFHSHAEISLAAPWLAAASGVQAVLLASASLMNVRPSRPASRTATAMAQVLLAASLLFPLAAPLQGQAWARAEVFAFMPDPTALATLGALMVLEHPGRGWRCALAVLPVWSLLLGAATRWLLA